MVDETEFNCDRQWRSLQAPQTETTLVDETKFNPDEDIPPIGCSILLGIVIIAILLFA